MKFSWKRLARRMHYWASLFVAVPLLVIISTGTLLLLKKEFTWIQPGTIKGSSKVPAIGFEEIYHAASSVEVAAIKSWDDIERLDVRASKGVVKVKSSNSWEVQIDLATGEVLQAAYRRSDLIESIHDGSFFHPAVKLWIFLPSAVVLLVMLVTGLYLFAQPLIASRRRKRR
jgi:uncharacterized iron-regulated membrane protein